MNIVAIIEARMLSTRLPGKVMHTVQGKYFLEHMICRVQQSKYIDSIYVATSEHESCNPIVELCEQMNVGSFRGSEEDVLDRVVKTGKTAHADIIVELCGDSPLIDPAIIDSVCNFYLNNDIDFCSNAIQRVHPIGMDVKVFSQETIEEVDALTDDPCDREHVSLYIYENPDKYKIMHLPLSIAQEDIDHRLTLDTLEDKHLITTIFNELYPKNQDFRLENIINLLKNKPELDLLNTHIQQKIIR
ncbi:glycosyltransferase family protein [bacterium]|jgi:spore coat polysaccharide biosynthesis protein SpsF|nr:glycosyltransferase family protein [bacterium]